MTGNLTIIINEVSHSTERDWSALRLASASCLINVSYNEVQVVR